MSDINSGFPINKENLNPKTILIVVSTLFISLIVIYILMKATLYDQNCRNIESNYDKIYGNNGMSNLKTLNFKNDDLTHSLRDYYIKTAYNCCSSGQFKNDYVSLCALKECFKQGVRCLDFEIYSIDNKPQVATSSVNDNTVKETYNSIPLSDVLTTINEYNNSYYCPNSNDPLILHFRIMSNNCKIYKDMGMLFENNIDNKLSFLGVKYGKEFGGHNFSQIKLADLYEPGNRKGKVVIIVSNLNPLFRQVPELYNFVNLASGSIFCKLLRYNDIAYTQDLNLTEENKKIFSIALPNLSPFNYNQKFNVVRQYGFNCIAMSFQNYDSQLENYIDFFDDSGYAFVLKPKNLRFIPTTIPCPQAQNKSYSYEKRPLSSDYYNYSI